MSQYKSTDTAPASLLPGVLSRLERRQVYRTPTLSVQELVEALSHPQWEMRSAVVRALGELGEQAPYEPLIAALHDEHRLVRVAAVRALGRLGERVQADRLVIALQDHAWEVREMAVLTLGERDEPAIRPLLQQLALQDTNSDVREAAASALSRYNATRPVPVADHQAMARTSALTMTMPATRPSLLRRLTHSYLLLKRQIVLMHKSLWIGPPLLQLLWCLLSFYNRGLTPDHGHTASLYLALFTTISAAAGTAFIYGDENDPGFELTLSTQTSIRGVMFARFLLVVGYNVLLSACASVALVLLYGGGFWDIMQLWLGPLVLLSSMTLTLSMLIGSWFALAVALIVEVSQSFVMNTQQHWPQIEVSFSTNWHTTPAILGLAAMLIAFAVFFLPQRLRLSRL
ncbi:hypothetical protein ccbrp13_00670 [Ktedonobacteria bacterium brp13]|nr:hypothetical protein ccbrp13_00670 [Ktedonobacteria bacterium brp13]